MEPISTIPTPAAPLAANDTKTPTSSNANKHSDRKNRQPLLAGLIICAILAVAGIAFGIYGVVASNHKSSEIDGLKSLIAQKDQTIESLKNPGSTTPPANDPTDNPTDAPAEPTSNSYSLFASNRAKTPVSVFGHYYHYVGPTSGSVERTVLAKTDQNHHLTVTDLDDNDKVLAEADDVISVYYVHIGNGGVPYFYLLHKDGKVSRISLLEDADHAVESLSDHKDIVSVIEGSDLFVYLVDINGNVYKTN